MSRAAALARSTFALSEFLTSVFSGSAFYMTLLPSLTLPLVTGASPARTNQAERVDGWLRRKRQLKDESRSSDIGNVPVLEAPSIPTLYRRFQITAALSDTAVWVCILASLFDLGHRFLLLTHRLDLFFLSSSCRSFSLHFGARLPVKWRLCLGRQTR
jgi:hypothetical protein